MRVAIDKTVISKIKSTKQYEYIYIFDDSEALEDLVKLNMRCVHKDYFGEDVEVNLTNYNIFALKKANVEDKDWDDIPPKKDYKFAIIVPNCNNDHGNYKGKSFFRNCIESILNQTYKNFELIIVDDMSIDTSVETVKSYNDKRIHLIQNKRKRYNGGSRNVGIEYALDNLDFDYFCFLDSDDWWKHDKVLETINKELYNHEMLLMGCELIDKWGVFMTKTNYYDDYKDFFLSDNKVWCTAWVRVIRRDKIVYFCEDTLMEDRVWSYRQADNVNLDRVKNLKEIMYVWNRTNTGNSVSQKKGGIWNASAYCHVGHQLQLLENLKHREMVPILEARIKECINKIRHDVYEQH